MNFFRNLDYNHSTTLTTLSWEQKLNPTPKKQVVRPSRDKPHPTERVVETETYVKIHISNINNPTYLNKRSELALRCRDKAKSSSYLPRIGRKRSSPAHLTEEEGYGAGVLDIWPQQPKYQVWDHVIFCHVIRKGNTGADWMEFSTSHKGADELGVPSEMQRSL